VRAVDFSFASLQSNVSPTLTLTLFAYNRALYNTSIDFCNFFGGLFCPLPLTNLSEAGTYNLPDSFRGSLPGIAFTVPDLDALARVTLDDAQGSQQYACVRFPQCPPFLGSRC
jgi:hypothetical protein